MRAIIVDDEYIMIKSFIRLSSDLEDLNIVGQFQDSDEALAFVTDNNVDIAFLDIEMPVMNGIELATKLKEINKNIIIVFVSAYESYIRESNEIGGDYYIVKPYTRDTLRMMMDKMKLLKERLRKDVYFRMFGRFTVVKQGVPVPLNGKAKEILALIATRRGKEISNEEIYSTIWEGRAYSNVGMKVYYNALKRLRDALEEASLSELLISTIRGQMLNVSMVDCDYYDWQDEDHENKTRFDGEFLSEYSWGEQILADILEHYINYKL